ncbi:nudix hydrolase chloroplastic-like [Raphidocelis subcapitata]|uniref:Nudix hydrolase chloroplastic-like n=1 Tax=Raphidocelis subcapitata TaxID=307507 RepID=A0A2V0NVZ8_9CHLO|nr:nudix hydrolase chloroplastic-like [Raphidocelis subcapitata]|eukprot:GBF91814.1 nudix hydrolase chloroplastic-like [Raphidocelis subcapitata]
MPRPAATGAAAAAAAAAAQPRPLVSDLAPMLQKVAELNNGLEALPSLVPFVVDGHVLGRMRPEFAEKLASRGDVFQITAAQGQQQQQQQQQQTIRLNPALATEQERTRAVAGFVEAPDGTKRLWVARRSRTKQTWPGKLDHIVAGGQPYGISCRDNVIKECGEEASVPPELAAQAVAAGFISYVSLLPEGLKPDVLYCYDLRLPEDFVPQPQDGEVEEFVLWDLERVAHVIAHTDDYKPNCGVVVMDFLVRHGYITPDMPGYTRLVAGMREGGPC